jgi:hypothetical protein
MFNVGGSSALAGKMRSPSITPVNKSISALARRVIGILAPPASRVGWRAKFPTCLNCGSDDFLCGTGVSEGVSEDLDGG